MNLQTLTNGETRKQFTTKETAQFIREALKKHFPGVKFSVRTSYASMTSSTHIGWTDGPTSGEVERVTDQFTSKGFDGMTDSTTYHDQMLNGERVSFSGWVTTRRELSNALLQKALDRFQAERKQYGLQPANVFIDARGFVSGPDVNALSGICGAHMMYVSDAINTFAYTMRANGVRVTMKGGR